MYFKWARKKSTRYKIKIAQAKVTKCIISIIVGALAASIFLSKAKAAGSCCTIEAPLSTANWLNIDSGKWTS